MSKFTTKVNYANSTSNALRCGLPKSVAEKLDVVAGDSIKWIITETEDNKKIVTVEKLEL